MYNKEYYLDKKKKLDQRFAVNKDKILARVSGMLNEFWEEQRNIQQDIKDIEEVIKSKEIKEVDKKCPKK